MDRVSEGNIFIALFAILIYIIIFTDIQLIEDFGTSPGTLVQLYAKGPQDLHLTGTPSIGTLDYNYQDYYPAVYPHTVYPHTVYPRYNQYVFDNVAVPSYYGYRYTPYMKSPRRRYWRFLDEFPVFW